MSGGKFLITQSCYQIMQIVKKITIQVKQEYNAGGLVETQIQTYAYVDTQIHTHIQIYTHADSITVTYPKHNHTHTLIYTHTDTHYMYT